MDKVIVIKNLDGSCAIVHPAPEMFNANSRTRKLLEERGITFESDEEVLGYIIAKDVPAGADYFILDKSDLPEDRAFRNAWIHQDGLVDIDMPKAVELHKDKLRALRKPLLAALDIDYQRADENNDAAKKQEIITKKQLLRDVTSLEFPATPEELKAFIPEVLQ